MLARTLLPAALYGVLMLVGILGNALVLVTIIITSWEGGGMPASDLILAHLVVINLLTSVCRNPLIFAAQVGLDVHLSHSWCRFFMFLWMFLRTTSVWATFCVSFFHYLALRRTHLQIARPSKAMGNAAKAICATWIINFLYSTPAFIYSTHVAENATFTLILLSSTTTRPLMGCVWDFPSPHITLLYISASLAIHEILPIFLMMAINLCTLYHLKRNTRLVGVGVPGPREASKRRAAKVILVLVLLFVACWGTNVLAVNYYNFARGNSASSLLLLANFCASFFLGFSPLVLLSGHSKLRLKLQSMMSPTPCINRNQQCSRGCSVPQIIHH